MRKAIQIVLFVFAVGALITTAISYYQIVLGSTIHGAPVRFLNVVAGPYQLKLALYADPLPAGDALPFNIAPATGTQGPLTYTVTANPGPGVSGSMAEGEVDMQQQTPYGTPGDITFVTRGTWLLNIRVDGPAGPGRAVIPLIATAPPPIPTWLAWSLGLLPAYGLLIFWSSQWWQGRKTGPVTEKLQGRKAVPITEKPQGSMKEV